MVRRNEFELEDSPNPYKNQVSEKFVSDFHDTVSVDVARHPELSQTVNVNSTELFRCRELTNRLRRLQNRGGIKRYITAYYKTYLKEPLCQRQLVEQRSQPVAVIGAVKNPNFFS